MELYDELYSMPKMQALPVEVKGMKEALAHRLKVLNDDIVWYGDETTGHTYGLRLVGEINSKLEIYDQNKPKSDIRTDIWGPNSSFKPVRDMYKAYPEFKRLGRVVHIGTMENDPAMKRATGLSPAQWKKVRKHLGGNRGLCTEIVCSEWASLLGYPTNFPEYMERAATMLEAIARTEDYFAIKTRRGRTGQMVYGVIATY